MENRILACTTAGLACVAGSFLLFSLAHASGGNVLKVNSMGCLTEEAHSELMEAVASRNRRQYFSLAGRYCFAIAGRKFSVVKPGASVSKVRVVLDGETKELYTATENTK